MLNNVQKEFLQKSNPKCWFKSILDMGCQTLKNSQILVSWLQMVYKWLEVTSKNRNSNEMVILEKYTVSSYMLRII